MSLRINNNIQAMIAHNQLESTSVRLSTSMERLSSGLRVNRSADDAAGLGISEKMRAQIKGLQQARRNSQDGISLVQTMDGALQEVHNILHRARDLALQFNNSTYGPAEKQSIINELASLSAEIGRIGVQTQFNGIPLLQTGTTLVTLQVGADDGDQLIFPLVTLMNTVNALTNPNDFFLLPFFTADISVFDTDIDRISQERARLGSIQQRLEHSINQAQVYEEGLLVAESRIRDTDMAQEMTEYTKLQILQQSGTSMLSLANRLSSDVLSLLRR